MVFNYGLLGVGGNRVELSHGNCGVTLLRGSGERRTLRCLLGDGSVPKTTCVFTAGEDILGNDRHVEFIAKVDNRSCSFILDYFFRTRDCSTVSSIFCVCEEKRDGSIASASTRVVVGNDLCTVGG